MTNHRQKVMELSAKSTNYHEGWSNSDIVGYYSKNRNTFEQVYKSERYFLDHYLKPGMKVLDFGCAAGGFLDVLLMNYGIQQKDYYGIDISHTMIETAREKFPNAQFFQNLEYLSQKKGFFDFVYSFGVLHVNLDWRDIIRRLYALSRKFFVFDLRIIKAGSTIENISESYQLLKFSDNQKENPRVPYIIVNDRDVHEFLKDVISKNDSIKRYGYNHSVSDTVHSPYKMVDMQVFCIHKAEANGLANV